MRNSKHRRLVAVGIVFFLFFAFAAPASAQDGASMVADLVVVRPLSLAATAVGCVFFVLSLPFTVWSGDRLNQAGTFLVKDPGAYTFTRPLGHF